MKIIKEYPPNWETIQRNFPVKWGGVIVTYYPHVYCAIDIDMQKQVHEQVHLDQQEQMGVQVWWTRYINDIEFRFSQEYEAYRKEADFVNSPASGFNREQRRNRIEKIIDDISSPMYGRVVSRKQAKRMFR